MRDTGSFIGVLLDGLARGFSVSFVAEGDSMWPTIRSGDRLTAVPVNPSEVRPGEIVLVLSGHTHPRLLAHRVVTIRQAGSEPTIEVRGDAKRGPDVPVTLDRVVARVVAVERGWRIWRLDGPSSRMRDRLRVPIARALSRWLTPPDTAAAA